MRRDTSDYLFARQPSYFGQSSPSAVWFQSVGLSQRPANGLGIGLTFCLSLMSLLPSQVFAAQGVATSTSIQRDPTCRQQLEEREFGSIGEIKLGRTSKFRDSELDENNLGIRTLTIRHDYSVKYVDSNGRDATTDCTRDTVITYRNAPAEIRDVDAITQLKLLLRTDTSGLDAEEHIKKLQKDGGGRHRYPVKVKNAGPGVRG